MSHTSNTGSTVNCTGRITWQIASFLFQLPFLPSVHLYIPKTRLPTPLGSRLNNLQCVTTEKNKKKRVTQYFIWASKGGKEREVLATREIVWPPEECFVWKKGGEPHYEGGETGHWRSGLFIPEQIIPSKCKKRRENTEERKLNWLQGLPEKFSWGI